MAILIAMPRRRSAELAATSLSGSGDRYRLLSYRRQIDSPDLSLSFNISRFGAGARDLAKPDARKIGGTLGGTGLSLCIIGTVIRTVLHSNGQAAARFAARFYAVRASK